MLIDEYKIVNYAGGIEKVLCNFANEFVKRGYDISLVCLDTEKGMPLYDLNDKVEFINLAFTGKRYASLKYFLKKAEKEVLRIFGGSRMKFGSFNIVDPKLKYFHEQFISRLKRVISQIRPDVIICATSDSTYFAQTACSYQIPTITMCHTDVRRMVNGALGYQKKAWLNAKAVQVLMPSYVDILKHTGANNVVCIPNVVEEIQSNNIADLKKNKDTYTVITVGRVEKSVKRTHLLVEAFAKISNKFPNWELIVLGELDKGGYKRYIDSVIKKSNINRQVHFGGVVHNVLERLRYSDIFVLPSESEGFSLALTEAMSVGLPVVGYKKCSSVNELIVNGKNGFLCEDGIDDLAEKLSVLMQNKNLRVRFGVNSHEMMKEYAPKKIWDKWENLINTI